MRTLTWGVGLLLVLLGLPGLALAGTTSATLDWDANTEADIYGYNIYRCTGGGCSPTTLISTVTAPTHTFFNSGLTPSTTYGYQIDAFDFTAHSAAKTSPIIYYTTSALTSGISTNYPHDVGICNDPAVIYCQAFENTVASWSVDFTGGGPTGISNSTDVPPLSGGIRSARLIPDGINGQLYHELPSDYDELYMRVYIKYITDISHHSGMHIGGYENQNGFPQGDAGIKDGDRFISSFEQFGSPDGIVPQTRMDFYNNYVGMHGAGCCGGLFFGETFLTAENLPLQVGTWHCYEIRIKVNTTAINFNGEQQLWIDGLEVQNFVLGSPTGSFDAAGNWTTGAGSPFPGFQWRDRLTYAINWVKIQNYSDLGTPSDVFFDDLVVATSYIGPLTLVPPIPVKLQGKVKLSGKAKLQ